MGKKITIYSSESVKNTHDRLKKLVDKIEEKESQSIVRGIWNILYKKPFIGKKRS